jgi:hypothetical protein
MMAQPRATAYNATWLPLLIASTTGAVAGATEEGSASAMVI